MNRILVIRGGAIGDFILTLPALKAIRAAYPSARIEILGYKHIAALAENRFYAQAVRSIEYGPLSSFFAKNSELSPELRNYFASFDLVISYLYDPDGIFRNNLRCCGVQSFLEGPAKIDNGEHAARQLARPIAKLGVHVEDLAAKIYPSPEDRLVAATFLSDCTPPIVAFHPGSGSESKNWPLENWIQLGNWWLDADSLLRTVVIVSGEADEEQVRQLELRWTNNPRVHFVRNLPLPALAALLEHTIFVGHDSGISHLAAGAGANCILLFGPTDPVIWAPLNKDVRVLCAPNGDLGQLGVDVVRPTLDVAQSSGLRPNGYASETRALHVKS
jgi:heptosyltransferase-2